MKECKNMSEIEIPLSDLPLEEFKKLISSGVIEEEIPFELLCDLYPTLLKEWYPGYPGAPRERTQEDPMCLVGDIRNGKVVFNGFSMLANFSIPLEGDVPFEGEHEVWLRRDGDAWIINIVAES